MYSTCVSALGSLLEPSVPPPPPPPPPPPAEPTFAPPAPAGAPPPPPPPPPPLITVDSTAAEVSQTGAGTSTLVQFRNIGGELLPILASKKIQTTPSVSLTGPGPVSGAPSEVVQPSDGRASLLESIRNAGGIGKAKLRNVKERKMEKKKQKEQEQGTTLMLLGVVPVLFY